MDISIRRHEHCVIGLPRCDFVFSSTRSCFIAYGFEESTLEMSLLRKLLQERGIEAVEAGGSLAPGQSAYCAKICSKIITAQFCIALLNHLEKPGNKQIPSANVCMEYGLMLGFNKYVIPFQRKHQKLPFNVAGLDTVSYGSDDFERLAVKAIDQAIASTTQQAHAPLPVDQELATFLLMQRALRSTLQDPTERSIAELCMPLGFELLNDFRGSTLIFFGNFTALRTETALWRLRTFDQLMSERVAGARQRPQYVDVPEDLRAYIEQLLRGSPLWILVTSEQEKAAIVSNLQAQPIERAVTVFCQQDVTAALLQ
ncbi:MAG TPA: hypothetical protein PKB14_18075 [Rubrivivax sp.]|nr:hypothetical protein [Rubrivivax sp.]